MRALDEVVRKTFSLDAQTNLSDQDGPGTLAGWDSLGHMTLLAAVQSRFGLRFEVKDILRIERLGDIRSALERKGVVDEDGR